MSPEIWSDLLRRARLRAFLAGALMVGVVWGGVTIWT